MWAMELNMNKSFGAFASSYPADIEELAGMAARRISIATNRANGLSWSVSRKEALTAVASDALKQDIQAALAQGVDPKQAVYDVFVKIMGKHKNTF